MNKLKGNHPRFVNPNGGKAQHDHSHYWKGIHRDWRIWLYAMLMVAAMLIFVTRRNWRGRMYTQPQQPVSETVGK